MTRHQNQNSRRAFTLVELLVAAALTVLIAAVLLGAVSTLLTIWNRTQGRLAASRQATRVLDMMAKDVQGAISPENERAALVATIQVDEGTSGKWVLPSKPPPQSLDAGSESLRLARFGVAGVFLRFFTTRIGTDRRNGTPATPGAVSYQLIRRPKGSGSGHSSYQLYRADVTASATMDAGFDLEAAAYAEAATTEGSAGDLRAPPLRYVVGENVVDFGVRFYASDPASNELVQIFPLATENLQHSANGYAGVSRSMPRWVDVMIRVLTDEGARRIAALEDGKIAGDWWEIATAHSEVFTRRIAVLATGD